MGRPTQLALEVSELAREHGMEAVWTDDWAEVRFVEAPLGEIEVAERAFPRRKVSR